MAEFRNAAGQEIFVQEWGARARRGTAYLLSGEGLPTMLVVGSRDIEPERLLEIQNRSGTAYDAVSRVNLGLVNLPPVRQRGDSASTMDGAYLGHGTGPIDKPGTVSDETPKGCEETAVWLISTEKARHVAVMPFTVTCEEVADMVSEAVEGRFAVESLYGSAMQVAPDMPVPGWALYVEPVLSPSQAPSPR